MKKQYKLLCCGYISMGCPVPCPKCGEAEPICEEVDKEDEVILNLPPFSGDKSYEKREWGNFSVLLDEEGCKVKKIVVKPKQRLSLQLHTGRDENWTIIKGSGWMHVGGKEFSVKAGDNIDIDKYQTHRIENDETKDLVFIEVQLGQCNEDDIIRIEDDCGRTEVGL